MQQKIPVICIQISLKNKAIKIDGGEGSGDGLQCATAAVEVVLAEMVVFFRSMVCGRVVWDVRLYFLRGGVAGEVPAGCVVALGREGVRVFSGSWEMGGRG